LAGPGGTPAKPQASAAKATGAGWRIIKFFLALALIPGCVGLTLGAFDHFFNLSSRLSLSVAGPNTLFRYFIGGVVSFAILAVLLWRPVVVYVFGHELVHAMATWMCLGKVSNLAASTTGGQVTTSKSNTFIRLAPYCVPLYALLAVGTYLALNTWWRPLGGYIQWLALALGVFYAFHVGFTLWSLRRDQPDLKPDGWLFSLVLIYIGNLAIFVLLMGFICDGQITSAWPALKESALLGWAHAHHIYQNLGSAATDLVARFR
jgi:hypothetical protein